MSSVELRASRVAENSYFLSAHLDGSGDLVLSGQDLGPGTAMVSSDGEYEYWYVVAAADIPTLLARLGSPTDADVLDVLADELAGRKMVRLEAIIRGEMPRGAPPATRNR